MSLKVVLLTSSTSSNTEQELNQRRMISLMDAKQIDYECVDGSVEENKERRNKLFAVSEIRGKYPQCFFLDGDGKYTFVGQWDAIESLAECDQLPSDVITANPNIPTFAKTFAQVVKKV